ncbi:MAG: hypothetical protein EOP19_10465 [Hyphomicrobiales bacterium]|nr:MAG: hypothetical protein EOP19_10465 [Hyphomicrobiales bacterium]
MRSPPSLSSFAPRWPTVTSPPCSWPEIYEAEAARRNNPELAFDDELDAALSRLERQTTAEDRHRVHEIGLQLRTIGGVDALRRAYRRMMAFGREKTRHVRSKIMETRWPGITGENVA